MSKAIPRMALEDLPRLPATLTAAQVAAVFGIGENLCYRKLRDGSLGVRPLPLGRPLRFATRQVLALVGVELDDGLRGDGEPGTMLSARLPARGAADAATNRVPSTTSRSNGTA